MRSKRRHFRGLVAALAMAGCGGDLSGPVQPEPGSGAGAPGSADAAEADGGDSSLAPTSGPDDASALDAEPAPGVDAGSAVAANPNGVIRSVPDLTIGSQCSPATQRGAARDSLRRLGKRELLRTLQSVFPSYFEYHDQNDPDSFYKPSQAFMAGYPEDVSADATENFDPLHSEAQIRGLIDLADELGAFVASSAAEKERYAGKCLSAAPSGECWRAFIAALGRALWRRPLAGAELDTLVGQVPTGDINIQVQTVVLRLLTSPEALFLVEASASNEPTRLRLTAHQVATRLAYALTDAPPDAALARAADADDLGTIAKLEAHAARLVSSAQGKTRFKRFVFDWLQAESIGDPIEAQAWYRENQKFNGWTQKGIGLGAAFKRELAAFFDYVVFEKKGDFRALMTLRVGFPDDNRLAAIYATAVTKPGTPVDTLQHPGLLTRAGLLSTSGSQPPTIRRGVMIKRRFLCDVLPSPDFAIIGSRLTTLEAMDPIKVANAEMIRKVTEPDGCMSCHAQINPLGFALETYSPIGIREDVQSYIWDDGSTGPKLYASFQLPGPQTVSLSGKTLQVAKPEDLSEALAGSDSARACMVTRFFRTVAVKPEAAADACALSEPTEILKKGGSLLEALTRTVVNEDIFWRKAQ